MTMSAWRKVKEVCKFGEYNKTSMDPWLAKMPLSTFSCAVKTLDLKLCARKRENITKKITKCV